MKNFEVANADDIDGIVRATKNALIKSMRDVFSNLERDLKVPGLTWPQLKYALDEFQKKEPLIIVQSEEM